MPCEVEKRERTGTYKLYGVFNEVAGYQDVSRLANPMDPVNRLCLCHWVPMRFHDMDMIGGREIHATEHQLMTIG